jgi:hypothetical protein
LTTTPVLPDSICIFIPKIKIWVNLRGHWNGIVGIPLYGHLDFLRPFDIFMAIFYTCGHLVFFSILVCCTKKKLATLNYTTPPGLNEIGLG